MTEYAIILPEYEVIILCVLLALAIIISILSLVLHTTYKTKFEDLEHMLFVIAQEQRDTKEKLIKKTKTKAKPKKKEIDNVKQ